MTITAVAFSKLVPVDEINARALTKDGIADLADSIAVKGLIQPLAVRPSADKPDRFEIIDGRRRYGALQRLVKDRRAGWSKASEVPVLVRNEDDREALETSLIANIARLPMHPVDQHDVFERLTAQGASEADLAARFGVSTRTVKQQLALARLAPPVREAWRKGKLMAEAAQAFTLAASHEAQAAALARLLKSYRDGPSEHVVRQELSAGHTRAEDVPAAVLERYTAAGGVLTDDLFSEERYVEDGLLLKTCEREWKVALTEELRAKWTGQSWAWVAEASELPRGWSWQWATVRARHGGAGMTAEQEERHNELLTDVEEAATDEEAERRQAIADAYAEDCEAASYTAEERARSGVVIQVFANGAIECAFGLIRPDDAVATEVSDLGSDTGQDDDGDELPSVSSVVGAAGQQDGDGDSEDDSPGISFALRQSLGEAQTRAVAAIVTHDSELALRLAVAALCTGLTNSPAKLSIDMAAHDRPGTDNAFTRKLDAVMQLGYGEVIQKFSSFVARSLQLSPPNKWENDPTTKAAAALVAILDPAKYATWMREAFLADDYFKRAPKAAAIAALTEMRDCGLDLHLAPEMADMKKAVLAERAAEAAEACGWLPPELRHPAYCLEKPAQRTQEAA